MSSITDAGFRAHEECSIGDTAIATTESGSEYRGTVIQCDGSSVYVQTPGRQLLEFRRGRTADGQKHLLLGVDGITDLEEFGTKTKDDSERGSITVREVRVRCEHRVVDFETEHEEIVLGGDS